MNPPEMKQPEECLRLRPLLSEYVDDEAPLDEVVRIERHLFDDGGCDACTSHVAFLRVTHSVLSQTPDVFPSASLSARIAAATYARPTLAQRFSTWLQPTSTRIAIGSFATVAAAATVFFLARPVAPVVTPTADRVADSRPDSRPTPSPSAPVFVKPTLPTAPSAPQIAGKPETPTLKRPSVVSSEESKQPGKERIASAAKPTEPEKPTPISIPASSGTARTVQIPASRSNGGSVERHASGGGTKSIAKTTPSAPVEPTPTAPVPAPVEPIPAPAPSATGGTVVAKADPIQGAVSADSGRIKLGNVGEGSLASLKTASLTLPSGGRSGRLSSAPLGNTWDGQKLNVNVVTTD